MTVPKNSGHMMGSVPVLLKIQIPDHGRVYADMKANPRPVVLIFRHARESRIYGNCFTEIDHEIR
jgi:hypothetical protein